MLAVYDANRQDKEDSLRVHSFCGAESPPRWHRISVRITIENLAGGVKGENSTWIVVASLPALRLGLCPANLAIHGIMFQLNLCLPNSPPPLHVCVVSHLRPLIGVNSDHQLHVACS